MPPRLDKAGLMYGLPQVATSPIPGSPAAAHAVPTAGSWLQRRRPLMPELLSAGFAALRHGVTSRARLESPY
jgi:hypothetical protein